MEKRSEEGRKSEGRRGEGRDEIVTRKEKKENEGKEERLEYRGGKIGKEMKKKGK